MTYILLLNCALKLVEEIILYYDARSKKRKKNIKFLYVFSENPQMSSFMIIRPLGVELFHADGRTDVTKLTVAFHRFVHRLANDL